MSFTALSIITDAYERLNKLSPGETLDADSAAFGFRRLNLLVDEIAAQRVFLYLSTLTTVTQTGHITLGAGNWASVPLGAEIISAKAAGVPMAPITIAQYNAIYDNTLTGIPTVWADAGFSTVYLWPVPSAIAMTLQTRSSVATFADLTTTYSAPSGYQSMLGASLAVRLAPSILGKLPPELVRAESDIRSVVEDFNPRIVDNWGFNKVPRNTTTIFNG